MLTYVRVLTYAPAGLDRIVCKDSETRQTLTYVRMLTYAPEC
jgi:hypothetical protein